MGQLLIIPPFPAHASKLFPHYATGIKGLGVKVTSLESPSGEGTQAPGSPLPLCLSDTGLQK